MNKTQKINPAKIYNGDVKIEFHNAVEWEAKLTGIEHITGYLSINAQAKLDASNLKSIGGGLSINAQAKLDASNLKSIGGSLYINAQVKLDAPNLKSVGGYLYINAHISNVFDQQLWEHNPKNKWIMTDKCSDWLLSKEGKITYKINHVEFAKELFDKVRKGKLSASTVFAIGNTEQRRVAYERMDKIKMRDLTDYKVVDEVKDDGYGYPMRIVSFSVPGFDKPFSYLNCHCPSTGREYFVETQQTICSAAKGASFGDTNIVFDKEY